MADMSTCAEAIMEEVSGLQRRELELQAELANVREALVKKMAEYRKAIRLAARLQEAAEPELPSEGGQLPLPLVPKSRASSPPHSIFSPLFSQPPPPSSLVPFVEAIVSCPVRRGRGRGRGRAGCVGPLAPGECRACHYRAQGLSGGPKHTYEGGCVKRKPPPVDAKASDVESPRSKAGSSSSSSSDSD